MFLRSRPDIVRSWSDEEVVTRILKLQGRRWYLDGVARKSTAGGSRANHGRSR